LASIVEAGNVRLARDRGTNASTLPSVASVLLAEVIRVVTVAGSRLAADTANVARAAERR